MNSAEPGRGRGASKPAGKVTKEQDDWRASALEEVRRVIREADPEAVEERKWVKPTNPLGVPVWSHNGGICTGETYKDAVKLTFFRGASLKDPSGLFTQSGTVRRAIDLHEGDKVDRAALKALILQAVALNFEKE